MDFISELRWRGMIHDMMPGTEEQLRKEPTTGYIGFDPTADSLHIGNLVPILLLMHFQRAGHKPIALVGGATGMVGDPSGKSEERKFLDEETLRYNLSCQKKQLEKFLDFTTRINPAEIVNNYDWFKDMGFLQFLREAGKYITVNYMMAKDSVKKRLETGISFTEFSYQLVQGYDFYWLYRNKNCKLQMGGSDQWGNIVTGTELIRRKDGGEAYALTTPLLTRSDGSKFGKSEGGNVWLDPGKTSPYKFYQYWLNLSDEDAEKYIKVFTFLSQEEIAALTEEHKKAPETRLLQKTIAREVTTLVHSRSDYQTAAEASEILFGKGTTDVLNKLSENDFLSVFEGVPTYEIDSQLVHKGTPAIVLLTEHAPVFPSKGEMRRLVQNGGLSINKQKWSQPDAPITASFLIREKYLLVQKGKKNYVLLKIV
ncbi:MAG TPA: tyrosine--tRNA ligase [Bacteroidales bacterium]|nr:tyrosine--tRNA ligase [Bacteroidales bacterium]